jgi:hypothetical protein
VTFAAFAFIGVMSREVCLLTNTVVKVDFLHLHSMRFVRQPQVFSQVDFFALVVWHLKNFFVSETGLVISLRVVPCLRTDCTVDMTGCLALRVSEDRGLLLSLGMDADFWESWTVGIGFDFDPIIFL